MYQGDAGIKLVLHRIHPGDGMIIGNLHHSDLRHQGRQALVDCG